MRFGAPALRVFRDLDGLPQNTVHAIAVDRLGRLWVGTGAGLAQFAERRGADGRLFVSLRPWSGADGVLVRLDDPKDPHPAWLFTSRHPARVVAALAATMDR